MIDLTADRLRELLSYDAEAGKFTWLARTSKSVKIGKVAGSPHNHGYWRIRVDGRLYQAHRLAWLYVTGSWPVDQLDHVNGKRDDNRIANLREATNAENGQNRAKYSNNTSGFTGVYWHRVSGSWNARIKLDGQERSLGYFPTAEAAGAAYLQAKANMHAFQPVPRS